MRTAKEYRAVLTSLRKDVLNDIKSFMTQKRLKRIAFTTPINISTSDDASGDVIIYSLNKKGANITVGVVEGYNDEEYYNLAKAFTVNQLVFMLGQLQSKKYTVEQD